MPVTTINELLSPATALLFMGIFARGIVKKVNDMEKNFVTKEYLKTELGHGTEKFNMVERNIEKINDNQGVQAKLLERLDERTINMSKDIFTICSDVKDLTKQLKKE